MTNTNDLFGTCTQAAQTALESCGKIGEAYLKGFQKLGQSNLELWTGLFQAAKSGAEKNAGTKDFQAFASTGAAVAKECGELVLETCKSNSEVLGETARDCARILENCVSSASNANFAAGKGKAAGGGQGGSAKSA